MNFAEMQDAVEGAHRAYENRIRDIARIFSGAEHSARESESSILMRSEAAGACELFGQGQDIITTELKEPIYAKGLVVYDEVEVENFGSIEFSCIMSSERVVFEFKSDFHFQGNPTVALVMAVKKLMLGRLPTKFSLCFYEYMSSFNVRADYMIIKWDS